MFASARTSVIVNTRYNEETAAYASIEKAHWLILSM